MEFADITNDSVPDPMFPDIIPEITVAPIDLGFRTYVVVPEPSTFLLFGVGVVGLLVYGWRRGR